MAIGDAPTPQVNLGDLGLGGWADQPGPVLMGPPPLRTWELPESGDALPLVPSDYDAAAAALGVEVAAVRAVAEVESGGRTGFDDQKRPKILFETHHFREETNNVFSASNPALTAEFGTPLQRASYKKDQWSVLKDAFLLDPDAAVRSASWGMFQVMGSNATTGGWTSLEEFVRDMFHSEAEHLRAFLGFCKSKSLPRFLATKNWAAFAAGYNGKHYAENAYDVKMANAYLRNGGTPVTTTPKAATPGPPGKPSVPATPRARGKR